MPTLFLTKVERGWTSGRGHQVGIMNLNIPITVRGSEESSTKLYQIEIIEKVYCIWHLARLESSI